MPVQLPTDYKTVMSIVTPENKASVMHNVSSLSLVIFKAYFVEKSMLVVFYVAVLSFFGFFSESYRSCSIRTYILCHRGVFQLQQSHCPLQKLGYYLLALVPLEGTPSVPSVKR